MSKHGSGMHKAAAQGQAKAQYNLGTLYFNGEGVPKDYQQALRWFRLAADQGEALAQTKIAIMYDDGQGCAAGCCPGV